MSLVGRTRIFYSILRDTSANVRTFSSTASAGQVKSPLNLDPSLQALLRDVDISLTRHKVDPVPHRELDVIEMSSEEHLDNTVENLEDDFSDDNVMERKSPAAHFGSQGIGAVVLPIELQNSINVLISESDKSTLHSDAKRLFQDTESKTAEPDWTASYDVKYRSRQQASRHSERDGTAFASVALPAHYSAIRSVLDHVKRRLGPEWSITRVIDWGAGTGSGLWASLHTFQNGPDASRDVEGLKVFDSTLQSYFGIDKRDGLVAIAKRLLRNIKNNDLSVLWQKSFQDNDRIPRPLGHDTLALSAFNLSSLPNALARKTLVKEMWESGAHTLVLIDHNTSDGFENIAEAREMLLKMGKKEVEDPAAEEWSIRGSHVVAPCPHDGQCPLHHQGSSQLVCGFSQRLQRPSFVRLTKHSNAGHEDIGYSYIVVRRGERPISASTQLGRIGGVGRRALHKEAESHKVTKELALHNEDEPYVEIEASSEVPELDTTASDTEPPHTRSELEVGLRQEAFSWPRLVFPPLKRSGHIILDACTVEGKIMRLTIPKSQGKQPYYDARKSRWGDIFPHAPKNTPQERHLPRHTKRGKPPGKGSDIGKRGQSQKDKNHVTYESLSADLKEARGKSRLDRISQANSRWVE